MRSRSSVLSHILGSNPDICGYSELHLFYHTLLDLIKMQEKLKKDSQCNIQKKYLLDKILHNWAFNDDIFKKVKSKFIFLLRKPESTLKSIINMGFITGEDWYKDPEQALKYYCSRLERLEKLSIKTKGNYFFIESDELIYNTETTLTNIATWLELKHPLTKEYSIFNNTGKPKYGDPSAIIKSGILMKTKGYPEIKIPNTILEEGILCYQHCLNTLSRDKK